MRADKSFYIAVDSCALINLAYVYDKMTENEEHYNEMDLDENELKYLSINLERYKKIVMAISLGRIKIVLLPTVFYESNHTQSVLNFIKKFCYCPNENLLKNFERQRKISSLARKYCFPYFDNNNIKHPAPMKKTYVADSQQEVPSNDAYIMAEATFENCCLLTVNKKDFIYKKHSEIDNERKKGIIEINIKNNFIDFKKSVPKPISLGEVVLAIEIDDYTLVQPDGGNLINCERVL